MAVTFEVCFSIKRLRLNRFFHSNKCKSQTVWKIFYNCCLIPRVLHHSCMHRYQRPVDVRTCRWMLADVCMRILTVAA